MSTTFCIFICILFVVLFAVHVCIMRFLRHPVNTYFNCYILLHSAVRGADFVVLDLHPEEPEASQHWIRAAESTVRD